LVPLDWDFFVGQVLKDSSIFHQLLLFLSLHILGLEWQGIFCFVPFFPKLFQKPGYQFILKLILVRSKIIEGLYANEFQPDGK